MALADFQRALANMTLDIRLAADVHTRGPEALSGYSLTSREQKRLQAVAGQRGMSLNCSLARANRFGPIHDIFPMTCVLLGGQLRGLLDRLWSTSRPDNYQLTGGEVGFADAVEAGLSREEIQNEYLDEILRYEKACWDLAQEVRFAEPGTTEGRSRTVTFSHDPSALFESLDRFEPPPPGLPMLVREVRIYVTADDIKAEWDNA
jgi:hypothetical protein